MSTSTKSSLTKRLPRHRLWFAGAGVAGIAVVAGWMMLNTNPGNALMRPPTLVETDGALRPGGFAGVAGWMMLNPNPGNALMRPPTLVETDGAFRPSDSQWAGFRFAKVEPIAFREERAADGPTAINSSTTPP